jgi:hypothetical protein
VLPHEEAFLYNHESSWAYSAINKTLRLNQYLIDRTPYSVFHLRFHIRQKERKQTAERRSFIDWRENLLFGVDSLTEQDASDSAVSAIAA